MGESSGAEQAIDSGESASMAETFRTTGDQMEDEEPEGLHDQMVSE